MSSRLQQERERCRERNSQKSTRRQKLHQVCRDRFDNFFNWRHNFSLLLQSTSKDKKRKKEKGRNKKARNWFTRNESFFFQKLL